MCIIVCQTLTLQSLGFFSFRRPSLLVPVRMVSVDRSSGPSLPLEQIQVQLLYLEEEKGGMARGTELW